jgi:WD40 repeat protein
MMRLQSSAPAILSVIAALLLLGSGGLGAQEVSDKPLRRFGTTDLRNCTPTFAFSPDGKAIAFVSGTNVVMIHDCRSGALLGKLLVGTSVSTLSFSPDGKRLLTSDRIEKTKLWNVATGEKLRVIEGYTGQFADQGRKIVTTLQQNPEALAIYDADTFVQLKTVDMPKQAILSRLLEPTHSAGLFDGKWIIATHPKGKEVVSVAGGERPRFANFHRDGEWFIFSNDAGIHVWNVKTGEKVRSIAARADSAVVVSPDGKQLAWSGYDNHDGIAFVWVCDLDGGEPRHVGSPTNEFYGPQYSPDGKTLAFITDADTLVVRDVATGKDVLPAEGHTGQVGRVQFTSDVKHVVSCDRDSILVWEVQTGKCVRRFPADLPAGERPIVGTLAQDFVITVAPDGTLRQRDLVSGREVRALAGKHGYVFGAATPAALSADASVIAVVSKDYDIRVYELASGKILLDFDTPCAVWGVYLSADNCYLSWTSQGHPKGDDEVHYLDIKTGKEVVRRDLPPAAFPLGHEVECWLRMPDLKPRLADLKLGRFATSLPRDGEEGRHVRLALSRDGRFVLARTLDHGDKLNNDLGAEVPTEIGSLKIWDIAGSRLLPPLVIRRDSTELAAISPSGRMLVTTTYEGHIDLWELTTGKKRTVLAGHNRAVYAVAFSPDGRYLVSGGSDTQVLLWDLWRRN